MAKTTLYSKDCPCDCDRRLEDKPCTDCCSEDQGVRSFSEYHGYDECPNVGPPCGSSPSPSCSNLTIGPITLKSDYFLSDCLTKFNPVAFVNLTADNFGMVSGESGQVGCPPSDACSICSESGTVTPFIDSDGSGKSRMRVKANAQNSPHGGPYSLFVTVSFVLEPK